MPTLLTFELCNQILTANQKKIAVLVIAAMVMLFGQTQSAWAEEKFFTVYFGGSGVEEDWWKNKKSIWGRPQLVAQLHYYHIETDSKHWTLWVDGPPQVLNCDKWSETIENAGDYLTDVIFPKLGVDDTLTLNLVGNSRGAVSTLWFASLVKRGWPIHSGNELDQEGKVSKINIIALDPVPGVDVVVGHEDYKALGKCVGWDHFQVNDHITNYVGIYTEDERTRRFAPVVPTFACDKTRVLLFTVPGAHQTFVGNQQKGGHHAVAGGIPDGHTMFEMLQKDVELKVISDVTAIAAMELLMSPQWGGAEFDDELFAYVFQFCPVGEGCQHVENVRRQEFIDNVWYMRTTDKLDDYYYFMSLTSFWHGYESYLAPTTVENCHSWGGGAAGNNVKPRCMVRIEPEGVPLMPHCVLLPNDIKHSPSEGLQAAVCGLQDQDEIPSLSLFSLAGERMMSGEEAWGRMDVMGDEEPFSDRDCDGVQDDTDNCPLTENPNQADSDNDGEGDACDPIADANGPYVEECTSPRGVDVQLDGSGSYDPDGHLVSYLWRVNDQDISGERPIVSLTLGSYFVKLTVTDDDGYTDSAKTMATVRDTTLPIVACNTPSTMAPPDAPISFTATAEDQCEGLINPQITAFDCFKFTKKGKRIDKTDSCVVNIDGNVLTILDPGGVNDNIQWTIEATDSSGNMTTEDCSVTVANPGRGK